MSDTASPSPADSAVGPDGTDLTLHSPDPSLHNDDLAPVPRNRRGWGGFEIFNVWTNDIQSLFGYTLAATLFISYGLNGW
ncbi:hypothetical protein ABT326_39440, partial [Streptomyces sp. NPDC000931]